MDKNHEEEKEMIQDNNVEYYDSGFPKVMNRGKYNLCVNKRLGEARSRRGYSLAKVKNMLALQGLPTGRSTIQGYEQDEDNINHRYPSLNMLLQLSNLYDCSLDYIFGVSDSFNRPTTDLKDFILDSDVLMWQGKQISKEEKQLIAKKIEQIMAL